MEKLTQIKSELKTLNEADLHGVISGAILEIKSRAYHEGFDKGMEHGHEVDPPEISQKSPQQLRDEIVEKAKRDVADLKVRMEDGHMDNYGGNSTWRCWISKVNFVVNSEKRTIVALVFSKSGKNLLAKGIAKCDPTDCFNVHIGEAIALRRALGLEVPTEYLNVPQPTEVRVGDVVVKPYWRFTEPYKVADIQGNRAIDSDESYANIDGLKILDDSREGVTLNAEEI